MRAFILVAALLANSPSALATEFYFTGQIEKIVTVDPRIYGTNTTHVLIQGFSTAGDCATNDGLVALALYGDDSGDRQLQIAIAAMISGKFVAVRVNDTYRREPAGMCYLKYLEIRRTN